MEERRINELIEELKNLRVREAIVIAELEATNKKRVERDNKKKPATETNELTKGDRVYVSNRVRKPNNWSNSKEGHVWTAEKERKAIVTRVTKDKIYIVTDNGVHTWRAPKNLEFIPPL